MSKEDELKKLIQNHRDRIAEAEKELREMQQGVKGTRILLTGEKVPEFHASHIVGPVDSHCPGKWVMVDMEKGSFYTWHPINKTWIKPPKKVAAWLKTALATLTKSSRSSSRK